jgi:hypothetical protein
MKIINCLETQQNIISYIEEHDPKRVLLLFLHGLGDFLGFRGVYKYLAEEYPDVEFVYGLDHAMGYEKFLLDYEKYDLIDRSEEIVGDYDFVFGIQYTQKREGEMCKAENCMLEEVGSFDPLPRPHQEIPVMRPRLVTVHFFSTWGPSAFGMVGREETAHKIWDEIIKAGLIPMETHFEHKYSNPENQNFEWMNAHVRGVQCSADNLLSLIQASHAFIGVISGNIHAALSCLPREKVMALTTYMPSRALGEDVPFINIDNYEEGSVFKWLKGLDGEKVKNDWTNYSI